jgi:hypothetical protein
MKILHSFVKVLLFFFPVHIDRLSGLVVRVLDYRCRGPGFDSRALQKKVVGSLVSTTEELLDRKVAAPVRKPRIRP